MGLNVNTIKDEPTTVAEYTLEEMLVLALKMNGMLMLLMKQSSKLMVSFDHSQNSFLQKQLMLHY
ncbi:MAG: hypothetical protein ACO3MF_00865 [Acholeplasmataceae bacterium]